MNLASPHSFVRLFGRNHGRRTLGAILGAFVLVLAAVGTARTQLISQFFPPDIPGYELNDSELVGDRLEDQALPNGVEVGDFVIRPELDLSGGYDSNTLGTADSGSAEVETRASFAANSDWTRNSLNVSFSVDDLRFLNKGGASYTNWATGISGSFNLGDDILLLSYQHRSMHLAATSLGAIGIQTPVPFSVDDAQAAYTKLFGRFSLTPSAELEHYGFGAGGAGDAQAYQTLSHRVESAGLTGRFEAAPGDAAVLILRPSIAQFDKNGADNYADVAGYAGLDIRGERIVQYRVLFGFEHRSFSDHTTPAVTTPTFELSAIWSPTPLDEITVTGVHRLDDPTSPFARDQDLLDGRIELDHELRRNVFLSGYAEGARANSRAALAGAGTISQTQLNAGASAVWNFNRYVNATLSYGYTLNRASGGVPTTSAAAAGQDFSSNNFLVGIRLTD